MNFYCFQRTEKFRQKLSDILKIFQNESFLVRKTPIALYFFFVANVAPIYRKVDGYPSSKLLFSVEVTYVLKFRREKTWRVTLISAGNCQNSYCFSKATCFLPSKLAVTTISHMKCGEAR